MFSPSGNTSRLEVPCLCYCCTVACSMIHVTIQAWHVQPLREHQSSGSPMPLLLLYCCMLHDPCHNTGVACSAPQGTPSRLEVPCLCYCCTVVCSMIHVTIQVWHVQPLREHQSSGSPMPLLLLYCCVLHDPCHNTGVACSAPQGTPVVWKSHAFATVVLLCAP